LLRLRYLRLRPVVNCSCEVNGFIRFKLVWVLDSVHKAPILVALFGKEELEKRRAAKQSLVRSIPA
jgi:hypothetical protein